MAQIRAILTLGGQSKPPAIFSRKYMTSLCTVAIWTEILFQQSLDRWASSTLYSYFCLEINLSEKWKTVQMKTDCQQQSLMVVNCKTSLQKNLYNYQYNFTTECSELFCFVLFFCSPGFVCLFVCFLFVCFFVCLFFVLFFFGGGGGWWVSFLPLCN